MGSSAGCCRGKTMASKRTQVTPPVQPRPTPRELTPTPQPDNRFRINPGIQAYELIWGEHGKLSSSFQSSVKLEKSEFRHQKQTMDENWQKEFSTSNGSARVTSMLEGRLHGCINISTGKIDALIAELVKIHHDVDQTIKDRTKGIGDETELVLSQIINDSQGEQQRLLDFAKDRQSKEEKVYQEQLQLFIKRLDEQKAKSLAELQRELQQHREEIFEYSQSKVRLVNEQANAAKQQILFEEQQRAEVKIQAILSQIQRASVDENLQHLGSEVFTENHLKSQSVVGSKAPGQQCTFMTITDLSKGKSSK